MTFWYSEVVEIVDVYYRTRIDNIISKGKRKKKGKSTGNEVQRKSWASTTVSLPRTQHTVASQ